MSNTTYIDNNGYARFKDNGELVHRSVAEMKLGRSLKKGEVVHHKNRDKQDNSF
ncbi:MAG: HNH endonuclease, partial [Spirochaetaceae bacterium]|nr:HNH endonuclease [Spirochaetaceae bacterium]